MTRSSPSSSLLLPCVAATAAGGCVVYALFVRQLKRRAAELEARRSELALELMGTRNRLMHSKASVEQGRAFKPKPDDVFVVTYPKCGTTWMTQICHVLRTKGKPELNGFGEITEVVPWDVLAGDCGQDLDMDQVASPRIFKSHERWVWACACAFVGSAQYGRGTTRLLASCRSSLTDSMTD